MKQKKQFIELSDEELKQVTGGASIDCSLPENKDKIQCHVKFERQTAPFQGGNWGETWGHDSFGYQTITWDEG